MKLFGLIELTKRLMRAKQQTQGEEIMAKEDIVQAGVSAIQQGEVDLYKAQLGAAYDGGYQDGVASVPPSTGGGFTQADIDAATAPLQQQLADLTAKDAADVQALADAKAQADAAIADMQAKLDKVTADKKVSDDALQGLKDSADKLQAMVDLLHSLFPVPVPQPEPTPEQPAPTPAE